MIIINTYENSEVTVDIDNIKALYKGFGESLDDISYEYTLDGSTWFGCDEESYNVMLDLMVKRHGLIKPKTKEWEHTV